MVGTTDGFGDPFLLEKGPSGGIGDLSAAQVVEVVFVPRRANFLQQSIGISTEVGR